MKQTGIMQSLTGLTNGKTGISPAALQKNFVTYCKTCIY
jgi:hypothetical protein